MFKFSAVNSSMFKLSVSKFSVFVGVYSIPLRIVLGHPELLEEVHHLGSLQFTALVLICLLEEGVCSFLGRVEKLIKI